MAAAIIDIGSSSAVVQVVEARERQPVVIARHKVSLRLGAALRDDGCIDEDGQQRTDAAFAEFVALAERHQAPVLAVATEAMRRAANAEAICDALRRRHGVRLQVIGGETEAALAFAGMRVLQPLGPLLGVDVGGGSTELVHGDGATLQAAVSLPLGAVTLTRQLGLDAEVRGATLAAAEARVAELLLPVVGRFVGKSQALVGASGSAQRLGRLVLARRGDADAALHGARLMHEDLGWAIGAMASRDARARQQLPGMDPERADVLLAGALILRATLAATGARHLEVALSGIRTGLAAMALGLLPLVDGLSPAARAERSRD
ncbi:MAG: hypothetical protein H6747_02965 [Deltaproteobacteria bacterium]|nr:hypothetical protein [Deltaproteobacteria bacterium]